MQLVQTTHIHTEQRGIAFAGGLPTTWLEPGTHHTWFAGATRYIEVLDMSDFVTPFRRDLEGIVPDSAAIRLTVAPDQVALITVDGLPYEVLTAGHYHLWTASAEVRAELVTMTDHRAELPTAFRPLAPSGHVRTIDVPANHTGAVFINGQHVETVQGGRLQLWCYDREIEVRIVDVREQELQITGQEVMTADKVTLRLNLLVRFTVTDALRSLTEVNSLRDALYAEAQLAAREAIGKRKLDHLLEDRVSMGAELANTVRAAAAAWGVEVRTVGLKDLVLPAEMKTILNQVMEAEKKAAANVIRRREETAATRSLANTAKLLADNPTLMRLKELESMKELAETIDDLRVVVSPEQLQGWAMPQRSIAGA